MKQKPRIPIYTPLCIPAHVREEIDGAMFDFLHGGEYAPGAQVEAFEREFAKLVGAKYCVAVDSGRTALRIAMQYAHVQMGEYVVASVLLSKNAVLSINDLQADLFPVGCDKNTLNIDKDDLPTISGYKCLVVSNFNGRCSDLGVLQQWGKKFNATLINDCSEISDVQGLDIDCAEVHCFDFNGPVAIGSIGAAGACVTNSAATAQLLRARVQDATMDEIQAAILRIKVRYFTDIRTSINRTALVLNANLQKRSGLTLTTIDPFFTPYRYAVRVCKECIDVFEDSLNSSGIETARLYKQSNADDVEDELVAIPMYPGMGIPQIQAVCNAVLEALKIINSIPEHN